jgi:hypothetical protein
MPSSIGLWIAMIKPAYSDGYAIRIEEVCKFAVRPGLLLSAAQNLDINILIVHRFVDLHAWHTGRA